jgi:hypothetical protein
MSLSQQQIEQPELYEMLYQYESDYNFDSTKFTETFRFQPTSYAEGVRRTTQSYRQSGLPSPRSCRS